MSSSITTTTTGKDGDATNPVPSVNLAIREDNKDLLTSLLRTDPATLSSSSSSSPSSLSSSRRRDGSAFLAKHTSAFPGGVGGGVTTTAATSASEKDTTTTTTASASTACSFRQYLVFANECLKTLLLRHVLLDSLSASVDGKGKTAAAAAAAALKPKKGQLQQQRNKDADHDADDCLDSLPSGLGIVGTRVLLRGESSSSSSSPHHGSGSNTGGGGSSSGGSGTNRGFKTSTAIISSEALEVSLLETFTDDAGDTMNHHHAAVGTAATTEFLLDVISTADVVTYFCRPTVSHTMSVVNTIRKCNQVLMTGGAGGAGSKYQSKTVGGVLHHRIVYLPNLTALCRKIITDAGLTPLPNVTVHTLPIDIVPVDNDVWTMDYTNVYREMELDGMGSNVITAVARSLIRVQDACAGKIGRVQSLGVWGEEIVRKMMALTVEEYYPEEEQEEDSGDVAFDGDAGAGPPNPNSFGVGGGEIDALLVLDRKVDLVTPMLTPLTYEGLLDDMLGINCGVIKVEKSVINPEEEDTTKPNPSSKGGGNKKVSLLLNGTDTLYAEVRNQHVEKFGSFLQNQAKALKESHSAFTNKERKKDLSEIHRFVKQIPIFTQNLKSLTNHIHLAELVKQTTEESTFRERWQTERSMVEGESCYETLEDLIACQYPPYRLLRLLCLQSLASGGIKSSKFDSLRREVVQTYGYEFLFVLNHLEKVGLFCRRETGWMDTSSSFSNLRKLALLINAEVNTIEPDDVSYVSSGYAPLTARLVQSAVQGWSGKDEVLRELPGRLIDITQRDPPEDLATAMKRPAGPSLGTLARPGGGQGKKPVLMVYFLGGVTFLEIAALRLLSKMPNFPFHILICTTKIINGSTFLQSLS